MLTPNSQILQKTEHNNYTNYLLKENKILEGVNFLNKYSDILEKSRKESMAFINRIWFQF